eukprot:TRINITY_DN50333_c0_g1_i1.p1 TRINITY_DN50333_c0_g1~~TRINITY_DN50333_c0_g1_i1.p1  ORF type:complete len:391 (+),score=47.57 TRINITY_DN50333_c0_g1_i1:134-1174(+)
MVSFGYLLFSPAFPIIPQMKEPAIVATLWLCIGLIMWSKIEYNNRAEVWYICLCRGIILDFDKTDSFKGWFCQKPILFAIMFLILFGLVTYIGLDRFAFNDLNNVQVAGFAVAGTLFVLTLTKGFVDIEGANTLLSLNMFVYLFEDPHMLQEKGFKVVHVSRLRTYLSDVNRKSDVNTLFSWNAVHALNHVPDHIESPSLLTGTKLLFSLRRYKDDLPAAKFVKLDESSDTQSKLRQGMAEGNDLDSAWRPPTQPWAASRRIDWHEEVRFDMLQEFEDNTDPLCDPLDCRAGDRRDQARSTQTCLRGDLEIDRHACADDNSYESVLESPRPAVCGMLCPGHTNVTR